MLKKLKIAGLLLYRQVKLALDRAEIAFVPIPSQTPVEQRWKIILLDETKRNEDHITWFSAELSWKVGLLTVLQADVLWLI